MYTGYPTSVNGLRRTDNLDLMEHEHMEANANCSVLLSFGCVRIYDETKMFLCCFLGLISVNMNCEFMLRSLCNYDPQP